MTLIEFARLYGESFDDNGAPWMVDLIEQMIQSGLTEESIETKRLHHHALCLAADNIVDKGYHWSIKDRLLAIQDGWRILQTTGENILQKYRKK